MGDRSSLAMPQDHWLPGFIVPKDSFSTLEEISRAEQIDEDAFCNSCSIGCLPLRKRLPLARKNGP